MKNNPLVFHEVTKISTFKAITIVSIRHYLTVFVQLT